MAKQNTFSKIVALTSIFGPMMLIFLGFVYNILSPREWAIGMLVWFAAILLFAIVRKLTATKTLASAGIPTVAIDDRARRRILRGIWMSKVWIALLVVSLPFGIAHGVAARAWLPTSIGVGINLALMYLASREIRHARKRLNLPQE